MYSLLSLISVSVPPLSYLGSGTRRPEIKNSTCAANSAILTVSVVKHLLKSSPLVHISAQPNLLKSLRQRKGNYLYTLLVMGN